MLTEAIRAIVNESEIVTQRDLQIELTPIKADINLMKWMLDPILGLATANFAMQFL